MTFTPDQACAITTVALDEGWAAGFVPQSFGELDAGGDRTPFQREDASASMRCRFVRREAHGALVRGVGSPCDGGVAFLVSPGGSGDTYPRQEVADVAGVEAAGRRTEAG